MAGAISGAVDLDKLDLDRIDTHERHVPGTVGTVVSVTTFGWLSELTLSSTNPDRLEQVAEALFDAAVNLRVVRGELVA